MTIPDLAETATPEADPTLTPESGVTVAAAAPSMPVAEIPVATPAIAPDAPAGPAQGPAQGSGPTPVPPPLTPQRRPLPPATNQASLTAAPKAPKRWAEVTQLAKLYGVPTDFADRNLEQLRENYAFRQRQSELAEAHPELQRWSGDGDNAALSKGEVPHLNRVANAVQGLVDDRAQQQLDDGDGRYNAVANPLASGVAAQQKQLALLMAALVPDAARAGWIAKAADYQARQSYLDQFAPEGVRQGTRAAEQHAQLYEGFKALTREGLIEMGQGGPTLAGLGPRLAGMAHAVEGGLMTAREALVTLGTALNPKTLPYTMLQSAAGLAPAIAGGVLGGPAGGFVGFLPMAVGGRIEKLVGARADLSDPQAIAAALSDPAIRKQILAQTAIGGLTEATVMTALSALGGMAGAKVGSKVAGATVPTAATVAAEGFASGADAVATRAAVLAAYRATPAYLARAAQHATTALAGAAAVGAGQQAGDITTTPGGSFHDFLATTGAMIPFGEAMHLAHAPFGDSPVTRAVDATMTAARAMDALRRSALMDEAGDAVREAPNTASQSDRLGALVQGVTGSDEHPTVYFQKADWDQAMAAAGLDPAATARDILEDQGAGYAATVDTDAPLAVPLDKLLSKVAPMDVWAQIKEIARHTPDGPTRAEAKADLTTTEDALKAALGEIAQTDLKGRPPLTEYGKELAAIHEDVRGKFAGQMPADLGFGDRQAEQNARVYTAMVHALATRAGVTPREALTLMPPLDLTRGVTGVAEGLKQTATVAAGRETLKRYGLDPNGRYTNREVATALEARQREKFGTIAWDDRTAPARDKIAKWMVAEILHEMQNPGASGIGWYSEKFQRALDAMSGEFPELAQDKSSRDLMTALIAITSDGAKVNENFAMAMEAYRQFKASGTFAMERGHSRGASIKINLRNIQELHGRLGPDGMRDYLLEEVPISQLTKEAKAMGLPFKTDYQAHIVMPRAAVVFGPKLGAFYANLMGKANYLTMDRWWSRTFNRYRGQILTTPTAEGIANFRSMLGAKGKGLSDAAVLEATKPIQAALEDRGFKTRLAQMVGRSEPSSKGPKAEWMEEAKTVAGKKFPALLKEHNLERAANTLHKAAFTELEDIPKNATDRTFMLDTTARAAELLKKQGIEMSLGDIQATLWYYEKKLYGQLGNKQSRGVVGTSYEEAARSLVGGGDQSRRPADAGVSEGAGDGSAVRAEDAVGQPPLTPASDAVAALGDRAFGASAVALPPTLHQARAAQAQGAIQGSTVFNRDGSINIQFFKKADKSTFFHELAHYYTAVLQRLQTTLPEGEAKGQYGADLTALRTWVGAKDGEALTVPQHEQIARGFEQYLQEGKAPSLALRDAFYRIRQWMLKLYRGLNVHGVQLTPEVRAVFDRMLASDAEIEEAERESVGTPLFGDDPRAFGLSDEQARALQRARDEAHQKAIEQQTAKRLKEITRKEKAKWAAWRAPIEAEVTAQVDADPVQKAIAHLAKHETPNGEPLSEDLVPAVKLSKAALVAAYGEDILNGIPKAMVSTEDGVPADVVADLYGFANGREFLDAVRASLPRDEAIRQETDARMETLHGAAMSPDAAKMSAQEYVMGKGREAVLRKELEILASDSMASLKGVTRLITKHIPPPEETKLRATAIIDDTKVGAVRPDLFRTAAFRAGNDAREALLAGDLELAVTKKKQELLATAIYDEAIAQRDRIDRAMEQMRKLFRSDARLESKHDLTFINGARALLGSLGIGSERAEASAQSYLALSREYAPEAYEAVEAISADIVVLGVSDYRKLTVAQFGEVLATVDQLWELSTNAKTVLMDGRKQALSDILAPIYEAVDARRVERVATRGITKKLGPMDKTEQAVLSFVASLTRVESWARAMDGLDVNGPLSRVVQMVKDGTNAYRLREREILPHLVTVSEGLRGLPQHKDIAAKEFGYTFANMNELLGALLHTGNADGASSNLEKLLVGHGWARRDAETGVVDRSGWDTFIRRMWKEGVLTKAHYDWVQAVWDTFETMKPDLQRSYLAMTGRHMVEVAHTGFDTPFGHYDGGYYPAIGDQSVGKIFNADGTSGPMTVQIANAMRYSEENTLGHDAKFLNVQPGAGMTKQRTGASYPLVIDAMQVPRHLDATMKYIHISVPVREAFKVFNDRTFREKMDGINPNIVEDALMPFLKAAGSQRSTAPATTRGGRNFERGLNWLRTGAMRNLVQMNPTILAEQVAHLATIQSMRTADNKAVVRYGDVLRGMAKLTLSPRAVTDWIHEQSPTVATRDHRGLERAQLDYQQLMDPSKLRTAQEETTHTISFVSHLITSVLDKSVWLAAYDRATARGEEPASARRIADNVVREGLGGHNAEDVSSAQRASAIARMLQGFYGFYNAKLNQFGADAFAQTMTDAGLKRDKMRMGAVYVLGFAMMGASGHAVRELMSGKKEDEGDGALDTALLHWAGWAINSQVETGLALVPYTGGLRSLKDAGVAAWNNQRPSTRDNTLASPFARFGEQAVGTVVAGFHVARGEAITGKDIKDALGLFGTLSHIPATVVARPLAYTQDVRQGRAHPTGPVDFTRGLLTGSRGGK